MSRGKPAVLVWRMAMLAPSETFIAAQVAAYREWAPVPCGLRAMSPGLPGARFAFPRLAGSRLGSQAAALWLGATGRSRELSAVVAQEPVEVVHAHFARDAIVIRRFAQRHGLPLVVTTHGHDVTRWPLARAVPAVARGAVVALRRRSLRTMFTSAAAILPVSAALGRATVASGAPPEKVRVHYVGIPRETAERPDPADRRGVLFIGRLVEKKGVSYLLAAYAGLDPRLRADQPLTVLGDGPDRAALEQEARSLGLDPTAIFRGRAPRDEVRRAVRSAAVVAVPSVTAADGNTEGLPTVLLEAAWSWTPVVATRHSGSPEAMPEAFADLLAPERDVPALRRSLQRVLTDPELAERLGRALHQEAEQRFCLEESTRILETQVYPAVAAPAARRS